MACIKKFIMIPLIVAALLLSGTVGMCGEYAPNMRLEFEIGSPYMTVNGTVKEIDPGRNTAAVIVNDRTMLPARAVVEEFGGSAQWNEEKRSVTLTLGENRLDFIIDEFALEANGEIIFTDTPARIIDGRTMIPVRLASEKLGLAVSWNETSRVVTVSGSLSDEVKLHFIDVGQGDAIFAELPGDACMLIDAGPASDTAADYIAKLGYKHINFVVATHPDADHIMGMPSILERFGVGKFYMPQKPHTTKTYERMITALASNGCTVEYAVAGMIIENSEGLRISVLSPSGITQENNNCSVVIRLSYGAVDFMLMGDAEKSVEQELLSGRAELDCEVLKVAHHGSKSSCGRSFIEALSPEYAVISVGADNSYGHPDSWVISRLESAGARVYRTDLHGTVIISTDGAGVTADYSDLST